MIIPFAFSYFACTAVYILSLLSGLHPLLAFLFSICFMLIPLCESDPCHFEAALGNAGVEVKAESDSLSMQIMYTEHHLFLLLSKV